jgi:hypothetical protein
MVNEENWTISIMMSRKLKKQIHYLIPDSILNK